MGKNRLNQIKQQKSHAEKTAQEEAKQQLRGADPWEDEDKTERVSMRIEPSLKQAFQEQLPRFASISDGIRDWMIRVAKEEQDVQ